jgi:FkbM family methyltransferase
MLVSQWQNFVDNGFDPDSHTLIEAAVGTTAGEARWPALDDSSGDWGARPIIADGGQGQPAQDHRGMTFAATIAVKIVPIGELIRREPRWDLVHIDVQGTEFDLVRSALDELHSLVMGPAPFAQDRGRADRAARRGGLALGAREAGEIRVPAGRGNAGGRRIVRPHRLDRTLFDDFLLTAGARFVSMPMYCCCTASAGGGEDLPLHRRRRGLGRVLRKPSRGSWSVVEKALYGSN